MTVAPFPTTRPSVVAALGNADAASSRAYDTLVACYWKPLYKYARPAWRRPREDAEDLTQSFFDRALVNESLASYDASKATFRAFLRLLFDRLATNERRAEQALKRGGGETPLDFESAEVEIGREGAAASPDEYFQREWVRSVFALAVGRLRERCSATQFAAAARRRFREIVLDALRELKASEQEFRADTARAAH